MKESEKIKLLTENKELQFDEGMFFCKTPIYKNDTIKCGKWSGGDQHFCKRCYDINYPGDEQDGR